MKRKFSLLLICFSLFSFHSSLVHAQQWIWAKGGIVTSGQQGASGFSTAIDPSGNVFMGGFFDNSTLTLGAYKLTLNAGSYGDVFIAKYDSGGNVLWAKSAGGTSGTDEIQCISTDMAGNVYATGFFASPSIIFGSDTLTVKYLYSSQDIFIVKYDGNGNVIWAKSPGGIIKNTEAEGEALVTDASENVNVVGFYNSPTIIFGSDTLINANGSRGNTFFVKYDANGNVFWAKNLCGTGEAGVTGIAIDRSGNLFITGCFYTDTITFGLDTLKNQGPSHRNAYNAFVAKYDANGNVQWAKSFGGTIYAQANSIATDAGGNIYMAGVFNSDTLVFGTDTLFDNHDDDVFLVKYDGNGNPQWAKSADGPGEDLGQGVAVSPVGNVYMTGYFWKPYIAFGSDTLLNKGIDNIFLSEYNANGGLLWAESIGDKSSESAYAIATNAQGEAYITGQFGGTDTLPFGYDTLESIYADVFIAKSTGYNIAGVKNIANKESSTRVFPNPNNGQFTMSLSNVNTACNVEIYNVLGEKVYTHYQIAKLSNYQIDLSGQPNGVYLYRVISENGELIGEGKVVVQR